MNSSTNTGVCSRAYFFFALSERSWYRSPRNRVSPPLDLERPLQVPCLGVDLPPERQQPHRRIAGRADGPQRRLPLGEQVLGRRDLADLAEDVQEILAVGVVGVLAEEDFVRVLGQPAPLALAGQPALVDQVVVLHEAHEDAGQHPGHRHLIQVVVPPDLERLRRAAALLDLLEGFPQPGVDLGVSDRTSKESSASSLTSSSDRQERLDVDHD